MRFFYSKQTAYPMPRSAFVLLVASVILSIIPHQQRLPIWLLIILMLVIVWRVQIFRQRAHFPSRWLRITTVMLAMGSVLYQYRTVLGPEVGVGLLVCAYCLKLLEMYTQRDAYVIVILSYFVLATEFLFSFSLYASLYLLFVFSMITAALVALNVSETQISIIGPIKTAVKLLLQAFPFAIALFFLFPRIGPIWEFSVNTQTDKTGLSDQMTPGDISSLSKSTKLAFRAKFEGRIPEPNERYWRTVIFDRYDGATWYAVKDWSNSDTLTPGSIEFTEQAEDKLSYQVILEPTGQRWLMSIPFSVISGAEHIKTSELMNLSKDPIDLTLTYQVESFLNYRLNATKLDAEARNRFIQLPSGNPRSRAWAREQFKQNNDDAHQFVAKTMQRFNQQEYFYTLTPPVLSNHRIDQFLFDTKQGFCAHYASALVFLLRSVAVPARLVGGYQGGEMHPYGDYMLVHQYDAHAWVEYWVEGDGWVRADPTTAIAPSRVTEGARSAAEDWQLAESPFVGTNFRNNRLISQIGFLIDYADYLWLKNVVNFGKSDQEKLMEKLFGDISTVKIALLMLGIISVCLISLFIIIVVANKELNKVNRVDYYFSVLVSKMEKLGVVRMATGETPDGYCNRAAMHCPKYANELHNIGCLYAKIRYSRYATRNSLYENEYIQAIRSLPAKKLRA